MVLKVFGSVKPGLISVFLQKGFRSPLRAMHYPHLIKIINLQLKDYFYSQNLWPTVPAAGNF